MQLAVTEAGAEQPMQQHDRGAGAGFGDGKLHGGGLPYPLAASTTLITISTPPNSTSQPIGSFSHYALTTTPMNGTSRNHTDATAPGSLRLASITHQVPIGAANRPI